MKLAVLGFSPLLNSSYRPLLLKLSMHSLIHSLKLLQKRLPQSQPSDLGVRVTTA